MGIRSGFALYSSKKGLMWYRSHNFGSRSRLRKGIYTILQSISHLRWVVIEGSRDIGKLWKKKVEAMGLKLIWVSSDEWRNMLLPHPHLTGYALKEEAISTALRVIHFFQLSPPKRLNHNAAEAILIGLWGVIDVGWMEKDNLIGGKSIEKLLNRRHN